MQTFFKFVIVSFIISIFVFGESLEARAQAKNQQTLNQINAQIKSILPDGWTIEGKLNCDVGEWGNKFKAYCIELTNPNKVFETRDKGSEGQVYRYNPLIRFWFVPRKGDLSLEKIRKESDEKCGNVGPVQRNCQYYSPKGESSEYILFYTSSEKTGWRDAISKITGKFNIK